MIPNMSSVSEAEQERQKWMTLKDALSHIQHVDQCDEKAALYSLRNALSDAAVAYQLEDKGRFFVPNFFSRGRNRLLERHFWSFISIDLKSGGTIGANEFEVYFQGEGLQNWYDPDEEGLQYADLTASSCLAIFVLKDDVLKKWNQQRKDPAEGPQRPKSPRRVGGLQMEAAIREKAREVYDEAGEEGPNLDKAYRPIFDKLAAESKFPPRDLVRKVLKEDEFKKRRRPVGNRFSKK
jgi:hypothetical protein